MKTASVCDRNGNPAFYNQKNNWENWLALSGHVKSTLCIEVWLCVEKILVVPTSQINYIACMAWYILELVLTYKIKYILFVSLALDIERN